MKIWVAMPEDWATRKCPSINRDSSGAICPNRTKEMVEDNLFWYEVEVLRKMNVQVDIPYGWSYVGERNIPWA